LSGPVKIVPVFPPFAKMTSYVSVPVGPRWRHGYER
jgi:hypothetical protein